MSSYSPENPLYSTILNNFHPPIDLESSLQGTHRATTLFMQANGYCQEQTLRGLKWKLQPSALSPMLDQFSHRKVSFVGPNEHSLLFSKKEIDSGAMHDTTKMPFVRPLLEKYIDINLDQAARLAFMLGGLVRTRSVRPNTGFRFAHQAASFTARMTLLGQPKSAEAIASAITMYLLSGGSIDQDEQFSTDVFRMARAIEQDPIDPTNTADLGLSQLARLTHFMSPETAISALFNHTTSHLEPFLDFPTVGAEFHLNPNPVEQSQGFLKRIALVNMSQYQEGSPIQMSRNDRGVFEVRMNPSYYPIVNASWRYLLQFIPEIRNAYFFATLNRAQEDFKWTNTFDQKLIARLSGMGVLCFAQRYNESPTTSESSEVNFGAVYLGQTVRLKKGRFHFTGMWSGKHGLDGQLSVYTGFDGNFPHLMYYLSMAAAEPNIIDEDSSILSRAKSVPEALQIPPSLIERFFTETQQSIANSPRLSIAHQEGIEIMKLLIP
ncbi:hypothetical protein M1563_01555 [Patescibacteria group bacterium]|nr:hypothetical protein [Patescibacteria group bacterium]